MKKNFYYDHFPSGKRKKILVVMKLKLVLLLCCTANLSANTLYSQQTRFDVAYQRQAIVSVLDNLKTQTGYQFFYQKGLIPEDQTVSVTLHDASLQQILDRVLVDNGYNYELQDKVVLITRARTAQAPPQRMTVSGRVLTTDRQPIVGAAVIVENTQIGTPTDANGAFTLRVPERTGNLVISYLGYQARTVPYTAGEPVEVVLQPSAADIDEVVVTGIFDRPRESYTGAVTTISEQDLKLFKGQNMLATLRNIDPSINIMMDNASGSNPNRDYQINIRGNSSLPMSLDELESTSGRMLNTPLIIMDGFEVSLQKLMDFNDEEIESINILKDASATSIYGSRGANGVIVVKTKDPVPGKLKIFVQAGLNLEIPDLSSYDLMGAVDKLKLERMVGIYDAGGTPFNYETGPVEDRRLKEIYNSRLADAMQGETEWIREPVRVGTGQRLNLRLEGGREEFRWSVSVGNRMTRGAMKGSERGTTNASITLYYNYKNLLFRNVANLDYTKADNGSYGSFSQYANLNTYFRAKDSDGNLIESWPGLHGTPVYNPLSDARLDVVDVNKSTIISDIFSIDWSVVKGFNVRGQVGISKEFKTADLYYPADHSRFRNYSTDQAFTKGTYDYTTGEGFTVDANITLSYSNTFREKHVLYAGFDASIGQVDSYTYMFGAEGLLNRNFNDISNALRYKEGSTPSGTDTRTSRVGFTGNVNYTYDNRYFVDGSFRFDGSSQFGKNNKFAPFWSLGGGWNIHREKFMADQTLVDMLRLRVSYGQTGSQQFSPYQARSMYSFYTSDNYLFWTAARLMALGNEDLTWQKTNQWNVGIDLSMFHGRLSAGLNLYDKKTVDLVSQVAITQAHGFDSFADNIGETRNYGFEANLGGYIIRNTERRILWNVMGRIAYTRNKIVKLSESLKDQVARRRQTSETGTLLYEGRSQNSIYAVRSLGIDPIDGQELFLDADGNVTKTWRAADRVYCGYAEPTFRGTLSSLLTVGDFTMNLSFAYHWGGKEYNSTLLNKVEVTRSQMLNNVDKRVSEDRWQKPGDVKFFRGYTDDMTRTSTRFVMDDKAFQLQSVSLQYRWHTPFVQKNLRAESVNFSVNMSDLFYLSSIKRERGTSYPFANNIQLALSIIF